MNRLSQSTYKKLSFAGSMFKSIAQSNGCNRKTLAQAQIDLEVGEDVIECYVLEKDREVEISTKAFDLGLHFEHIVLGAARGGKEPERPMHTTKAGKLTAEFQRMVDCANLFATPVLENHVKLQVKPEDIQPNWNTKYIKGHPDAKGFAYGLESIQDTKYTQIPEGSYSDYFSNPFHEWYEGLIIQASTYNLMHATLYGYIVTFFFLVFRCYKKTGIDNPTYRFTPIKFDFLNPRNEEKFMEFYEEMKFIAPKYCNGKLLIDKDLKRSNIASNAVKPNPTPENCESCPFKCDARTNGISKMAIIEYSK